MKRNGIIVHTVNVDGKAYSIVVRSHSGGSRYSATCDDFKGLIAHGAATHSARDKLVELIVGEIEKERQRKLCAADIHAAIG